MSNKANVSISIGFGGLLFLIFLTLRLTDQISWAWYWVAAPLWTPTALVLGVCTVIAVVAGIAFAIGSIGEAIRRRR